MNDILRIFCLLLEALRVSSSLSVICVRQRVTYTSVSMTTYQQGAQSYTVSYNCGFLNWGRCRRTYYRSIQQSSTSYFRIPAYSTVIHCCTGYLGTPPNCQADCTGGCQNGGICTLPDVCTCSPGWTGTNCETDVDECNGDHECDQYCSNVIGSYNCSCDTGYELQPDNRTCKDINECQVNNGGCAHVCNNTEGSYRCTCESGYELASNNHTCTDIGECTVGTHDCAQICIKQEGGFACGCFDGYILEDNGATCEDIDECAQGTSGCTQGCRNIEGSFICTCNDGYQTHRDDPTFCIDIDECVRSNGGCQHYCSNTIGSYQCSCYSGYLLGVDEPHTCEDINECSNSNGGCQHNCTNTDGNYYCSCAVGYYLDENGHSCSSIDTAPTDVPDNASTDLPPSVGPDVPISEEDNKDNLFSLFIIISVTVVVVIFIMVIVICYVKRHRRDQPHSQLAAVNPVAIDNNVTENQNVNGDGGPQLHANSDNVIGGRDQPHPQTTPVNLGANYNNIIENRNANNYEGNQPHANVHNVIGRRDQPHPQTTPVNRVANDENVMVNRNANDDGEHQPLAHDDNVTGRINPQPAVAELVANVIEKRYVINYQNNIKDEGNTGPLNHRKVNDNIQLTSHGVKKKLTTEPEYSQTEESKM